MKWWVYIVRCADGSLYTGASNNVDRRVKQHNSGRGAKYTRSRLPVVLVWSEEHPDCGAALRRESQIKALSKERREALIRPLKLETNNHVDCDCMSCRPWTS